MLIHINIVYIYIIFTHNYIQPEIYTLIHLTSYFVENTDEPN